MRGLILAAGRGSRLGALCEERPKCLVKLAGRTLLERQMAALRAGDIEQIGIVRGYRAELLQSRAPKLFDNPRWAQTNMVTSLATAAEWLRSGPVIVSYGDIFYPGQLVRALVEAPGALVIAYDRAWRALWTRRFSHPLADAETFRIDANGHLIEIGGRAQRLEEIEGQYMGLLKLTPAAWAVIEALLAELTPQARDRLDITALLRRLLADERLTVATLATDGGWGEVDNPSDLQLYEEMLERGELRLDAAEAALS
jgi:L-glutamine-phosphate cytidylyltransferase